MVRPEAMGNRQVSPHALPGLPERIGDRAGVRGNQWVQELCNSIIR
jgi:hypothetical protein